MNRLGFLLGMIFILSSSSLAEKQAAVDSSLINKKVERKIDLASQLVQISTSVTVENTGSSSADSYILGLDPIMESSLAFVGATVSMLKLLNNLLWNPVQVQGH